MKRAAVVITLLLSTLYAFADTIEVIDLHNRPAAEVIPLVEPLIKPGEAITGTGYQLILRASPQTVAGVRRMLAKIDTGRKNLLITVRHEDDIRSEHSDAELDAAYTSSRGGAIAGQLSHDESHHRAQVGQRVRVLEGGVAQIHAGKALYAPSITHYPGGSRYGTERRNIGTGLYVAPRLNGNRVNLEISPYRESLTRHGNIVDTQSANTVVSGQLGEWISLGGATQTQQHRQRGILSGSRTNTGRQTGIQVKVEVVD